MSDMTNERLEVRISSDLKDRLKEAAKADHRSLSSFVVASLAAVLEQREKEN